MTGKQQGNFYLDKTYLDFTDAEGNCFILYPAFFLMLNESCGSIWRSGQALCRKTGAI